jgi:prepilin-type processing-associated H-X9-DG protein
MNKTRESAFTRSELLVVLGMLCCLAMLKVAAVSYTKEQGESSVCMSNLRRLQLAWTMYVVDNRDRFPGNWDASLRLSDTNKTWCAGWLDYGTRDENTNTVWLMHSQIGKYAQTPEIYKCPSDTSVVKAPDGRPVPRVRSISMNGYVGTSRGPYSPGYRQFTTLSDIVRSSRTFVFIDEREDSINDATFQVDMAGYDPDVPPDRIIVDYPGLLHSRGANLSFVDGHVEQWLWKDVRTYPRLAPGQYLPLMIASPKNPDVRRLQAAASSKISK